MVLSDNGEKVEVVVGSGDVGDTSSGIYWAAPEVCVFKLLKSFWVKTIFAGLSS